MSKKSQTQSTCDVLFSCIHCWSVSHSVTSNSANLWTMALQVPLSWNFLAKNTEVGSHFILQGIFQPRSPALQAHSLPSEPPGNMQSNHACVLSHVWLFATLWLIAHQAPLSMEFSRQEYWSGLPFPSPGDLPHPGIEPTSLASPALVDRFFTTTATWEGCVKSSNK